MKYTKMVMDVDGMVQDKIKHSEIPILTLQTTNFVISDIYYLLVVTVPTRYSKVRVFQCPKYTPCHLDFFFPVTIKTVFLFFYIFVTSEEKFQGLINFQSYNVLVRTVQSCRIKPRDINFCCKVKILEDIFRFISYEFGIKIQPNASRTHAPRVP